MTWFREWLEGGGDDRRTADDAERSARGTPRTAPRSVPREDAAPSPHRAAEGADEGADDYPGARFGLPESGPGSVATLPRRAGQFALDALLAGLLALLFTFPTPPQNWSLLTWALIMVVPVAVIGATPAMVLLGLRVVRLDRPDTPGVGLLWSLVRTASVFFVVPALILDRDSRGLQDRASRTIVVNVR
ncbi:hypothetical protein [Actinomycetospora cinnamomea]|uniref:RDD family protein n=1 Tax=Actinomycetospora cinnamomea TaxID=663609 RepID=A0A2U1FA03_9PSEU|nr:hypothetical protein [Actinomycetospora cinnamomea]PVZ08996.1 hypothetical protein C8D89_107158 [Actinomycetospora cinnamomea]